MLRGGPLAFRRADVAEERRLPPGMRSYSAAGTRRAADQRHLDTVRGPFAPHAHLPHCREQPTLFSGWESQASPPHSMPRGWTSNNRMTGTRKGSLAIKQGTVSKIR
ncbi:unnamed protein product [Prorocentrum cordatum]|uniref:Uncharacterized protein n=1 Tax=Prorocentrum cordatum TaxID=2364126 RepID=A0ABN9V199_9DINO|nr:unnamed protein product [Polarella glacialis]